MKFCVVKQNKTKKQLKKNKIKNQKAEEKTTAKAYYPQEL